MTVIFWNVICLNDSRVYLEYLNAFLRSVSLLWVCVCMRAQLSTSTFPWVPGNPTWIVKLACQALYLKNCLAGPVGIRMEWDVVPHTVSLSTVGNTSGVEGPALRRVGDEAGTQCRQPWSSGTTWRLQPPWGKWLYEEKKYEILNQLHLANSRQTGKWNWRDGPAVKGACCSIRGPKFGSQHPLGQLTVVWNSSSRISNTLFWYPRTSVHICKYPNIHKNTS